jgi:hypothetical protein
MCTQQRVCVFVRARACVAQVTGITRIFFSEERENAALPAPAAPHSFLRADRKTVLVSSSLHPRSYPYRRTHATVTTSRYPQHHS